MPIICYMARQNTTVQVPHVDVVENEDGSYSEVTTYETLTTSSDEQVLDFSAQSLEAYDDAGFTAVAVHDDGTEDVVEWSSVSDPASQSTDATNEAAAVAEATNQHFFTDSNGAHVTEVEKDDWDDTPSGHNVLMNALGILLRKALVNLVSITQSAVAFFDGNGNESGNVTALFGREGAQIGRDGGNRILIDSDGLYGFNGEKLIFGAQVNLGYSEMYLGSREATLTYEGELAVRKDGNRRAMYFYSSNSHENSYTYVLYGSKSSWYVQGYCETYLEGNIRHFDIYDRFERLSMRILRVLLEDSTRIGISDDSYVVDYYHLYYELAWYDSDGTEISSQHEGEYFFDNRYLTPQTYTFPESGIVMSDGNGKPYIKYNGSSSIPTFKQSHWDTSSDTSTLPVLPCMVVDGSRLWYCTSSGSTAL